MTLLIAALIAWFGAFTDLNTSEFGIIEEYKIEYYNQQQEQGAIEYDITGA